VREPGFAKEGRTRTLGIVISAAGALMSLADISGPECRASSGASLRRVGRSIDDHGWAPKERWLTGRCNVDRLRSVLEPQTTTLGPAHKPRDDPGRSGRASRGLPTRAFGFSGRILRTAPRRIRGSGSIRPPNPERAPERHCELRAGRLARSAPGPLEKERCVVCLRFRGRAVRLIQPSFRTQPG
jgi:hypothetical protein